jgi:queuine/archaeosine tRNA-ribosyltransferase
LPLQIQLVPLQRVSLTPESSVAAQKSFGADIIIPLDEVGLYKLNAVVTHSLKAPGFNP